MTHYVLDARTATPHYPGIGRYVRSLAAALAPQLHPDERLTLLVDPVAPLTLPRIAAFPVTASPFSAAQQWVVPLVLRRLGAHVYHSPYYLMPSLPGVPTMLTVYDLIPLRHPAYSTPRARLLFRAATRLALRTARRIAAITETARQDFIGEFGIDAARITAIPLAADAMFTPQSASETARVRAQYGLPARFVLYLGSNKPHKNLVGLVRAWLTLPDRGATLVIAGAWDPRYAEARTLAQDAPREGTPAGGGGTIRWLGAIADADLPGLYSAAEAFVFPSFFEGFGLPVLEAMACGTPVVCSQVSALPEVAGGAALLFDPGQPGALRIALGRVLGDAELRADLAMRGRARAAAFSWQATAQATLALYRTVAGANR